MGVSNVDLRERLYWLIEKDFGEYNCWIWEGAVTPKGYGKVTIGGKSRSVHRVMYESFFGPIAAGMESHHLCPFKRCCHPGHVMMVSRKQHMDLTPDHPFHAKQTQWEEHRKRWRGAKSEQGVQIRLHIPRSLLRSPGLEKLRAQERIKRDNPKARDPVELRARQRAARLKAKVRDPEAYRAKKRAAKLRYRQTHPDKVRAWERAKRLRRKERDPEGLRAKERAKYLHRKERAALGGGTVRVG